MKPASIIFLILSVILIAVGAGLCFTASRIAADDGITLVDTVSDEDNNAIERHAFGTYGISRLVLRLEDVDVNIIGNTETSYIEIINFTKNTFDYTVAAKTMTLDNTIGLFSIFNFTETGISFNGLRHYLNYNQFREKPKTVNIYINPDEAVKIFDITLTGGSLHIEGLRKRADYNISMDGGNVDVAYVNTSSAMNIDMGTGDVSIITNNLNLCDVKIRSGNLYYYDDYYANQQYAMSSPNGAILLAGEDIGTQYEKKSPIASTRITANVDEGDIIIGLIPTDRPYVLPDVPPYTEGPTLDDIIDDNTVGAADDTTEPTETTETTETTAAVGGQ